MRLGILLNSLQVTNDTTVVSSIPAQECRLLATSRSIRGIALQPQKGGRKQWTQNLVAYSYNLVETHCSETMNYSIQYGVIAFVDGSHPITNFNRMAECNPKTQKCLTRHKTVIWGWSAYEKQCQYAPLGTYAAHVSGKEVFSMS